jgi:signal peptidase I
MNGDPTMPDADQAGSDEAETGDADASDAGPGDTVDSAAGDSAAGGSAAGDKAAQPGAARRSQRSGWRELPILLAVALVVALIIKTFVVQAFFIPSGSMENTLLIGDKILVNKLVYHVRGIQPGDIVVFNGEGSWDPTPPAGRPSGNPVARAYDATLRPLFHSIAGLFGTPIGQTDYVKRVIGVPGDHVACCTAGGLVTVNGVPLRERSYLYPGNIPSGIHFHVTVPPGRIWVMGDHRAISDDSRLHRSSPGGGTIPESKVIGRAFVIVWPPSQWRFLPIPATFGQSGISRAAAAAGPAARRVNASLAGATIAPEPSFLPLAGGLACAVPLTWLQRRARRRRRDRRQPGRA